MMRYLIKRMNRELAKSKFRAIGSAALVLVAVAAYVSFSAMVPSTLDSLETMVSQQNISDFIVHIDEGNVSDTALVSNIPGTETVDYRITVSSKMKYIDNDGVEQMTPATLVGVEPGRLPLVNTLLIDSGDGGYFEADGSETIVMERGFSYRAGIKPGTTVKILTSAGYVDRSVVGLAFSPEHIMMPVNPQSVIPLPGSLAVVYLPIDSLRTAFGFPNAYVNELLFLFDGTEPSDEVMNSITETLSTDIVTFTQQRDELYGYSLVKEDLRQGDSFTAAIAFLILLAAFFVTYSFFSRVVDEERKQIGVLRALGYSRGSVLTSYLYMAVLVGLGGSVAGVIVGAPAGEALAGYYVDTALHAQLMALVIPTDTVVLGLLFGPITTGLACTIAVWSTVSMEPHEAIKNMRTQKVKRRRSPAKRHRGRSHRLSYMTIYTLRNTFRHKRRTTFTAVAIAFSVVLGAMSFLMVESLANSISKNLADHENWDIVVDYSYPLEQAEAEGITVVGIEDTVLISKLAVIWSSGDVTEQTVATGLPLDQTLHEYSLIKGDAATTTNEAMIGYATSNDFGIEPGDTIDLMTIEAQVTVTVSGVLADMIGEFIVSMEVVEQLAHYPVFAGMYVECSAGAAQDVMQELEELPYIANAQMRDDVKSGLVDFMQSYSSALYAFSMVGVTIASLTIANVVFMGVLERQQEYGQLRAIGYSRRDVAKSVIVDVLTMIAIGGIVAVPLLLLVMESMVGIFREFWPIYSTVLYLEDWYGYGVVMLLTAAFGLLAAIPGIRFLSKMDIAKTVSGGRFG